MADISTTDLRDLCHKIFQNVGLDQERASITTDHYLENEMSGKTSHGMVRVVQLAKYLRKYGCPFNDPIIETNNGSYTVFDAQGDLGTVAISKALETAKAKAKEHGMAFIGIRNTIGNTGSMAYYLRRLVASNLIAIMGCNSIALVTAPEGKDRLLGTNPFGIGVPGDGKHQLIADFATSAIAYGKIMVAEDKNETIDPGLLIDKDGNPSTNPKDSHEGAILPLAGHAGFALGLMIELLAGPFINAKAHKYKLHDNDGFFMLVIDPAITQNPETLSNITSSFKHILNSTPAPGYDNVTIAGMRSQKALEQSIAFGQLTITDQTLQNLMELSK